MNYFKFKGIRSVDMGLVINKLPQIIKPARNIEKIPIIGRSGYLTIDKETYDGTIKTVECTLLDPSKLDAVCAWLDGSGDVIFSNQSDRLYKASIMNQIPFNRMMRKHYNFIVIFDCQPFAYAVNDDTFIFQKGAGNVFEKPIIFQNKGTKNSRPIMTIYGTGDITLILNGISVHLKDIPGCITLNSEIEDAYKETMPLNNKMIGEFPQLLPEENTLDFVGEVEKIEIKCNSVWI